MSLSCTDSHVACMTITLFHTFTAVPDNIHTQAVMQVIALLQFQTIYLPQAAMQVIALLEAYARKSPQAGLLARALPVLLSSLQHALRAGPPQQALAERLRGLVSNKLCK